MSQPGAHSDGLFVNLAHGGFNLVNTQMFDFDLIFPLIITMNFIFLLFLQLMQQAGRCETLVALSVM